MQVCHDCFWDTVNNKDRKCPNCGLYYDPNKASKAIAKAAEALEQTQVETQVVKGPKKAAQGKKQEANTL